MTLRGWALIGLSVALWGVGRAFGIPEMIQLSLGTSTLCLGAVLWVQLGRRRLRLSRSFTEVRVHRGDETTLRIELGNPDPLPTPPLVISQELPFGPKVETFLAPIHARRAEVLRHVVRPGRRGAYVLPPLDVTFTDPFGLASNLRRLSDESVLIVYPRVENLAASGPIGAALQGPKSRRVPSAHGEDLFGVRVYEAGDDPRKVHWPVTAKTGSLMVREDEAGARRMATVFLDNRSARRFSPESFERGVEAAASVVEMYARSGYGIRLGLSQGLGIKFGRGSMHYNQILEELAVVELLDEEGIGLRRLSREYPEGVLTIVTGDLEPPDVRALSHTARRYESVTLIRVVESGPPSAGAAGILTKAGIRMILLPPGQTLTEAWASSLGSRSWIA